MKKCCFEASVYLEIRKVFSKLRIKGLRIYNGKLYTQHIIYTNLEIYIKHNPMPSTGVISKYTVYLKFIIFVQRRPLRTKTQEFCVQVYPILRTTYQNNFLFSRVNRTVYPMDFIKQWTVLFRKM